MDAVFSFLKVFVIVGGVVAVVFLVLLALPGSRLRRMVLRITGWFFSCVSVLSVLYLLNPMDVLPDVIPLLGQVDDAAALINAFFTGIAGLICLAQGRKPISRKLPIPKADKTLDE